MIRPVDAEISQRFGDNPTSKILPGSPDYWIIQQFGNYQPDGHTGEDYAVPVGTPFRAVTAGTVVHVGYYGGTYADNPYWISPGFAGFCYVIDHGAFIGIYGHGQDGGNRVNAGDKVAEGQNVGLTGNTGGSTGPHLHFEILPDGYVVNSYMYGRINPETLFTGSLSYQSESITPLEEIDVSAAEDILARITETVTWQDQQFQEIRATAESNRNALAGFTRDVVSGIPAAVLNQQFTLPDGTVTNLAGILAAIHAQPVAAGTIANATDPQTIADAVLSGIRTQWSRS